MPPAYWEVQNTPKVHKGDIELDENIIAGKYYFINSYFGRASASDDSFRTPTRSDSQELSRTWCKQLEHNSPYQGRD